MLGQPTPTMSGEDDLMPRVLHTADWQIGRQYGQFDSEDAAALAEARFAAVERLAQLASDAQVDAVLVAGDSFDAQTLSDRVLHRTFQALTAFPGPWLMLPGNHDAALAESVWTRARRIGALPANVWLLDTPEVTLLPDIGIAVLPAPLTQRQTPVDLTAWFDTAITPSELIRVGLAHGSVAGQLADDIDSPNPIAADRAATARLDYLALGDWHGLKRLDARTWYSGTPEQERFKDNGAGQALLVTIDAPGAEPRVEPRGIGQHGWYRWQRSLTVATDADALLADLAALPPMSVLRLELSGQVDLATRQRLDLALAEASGRLRSLQINSASLTLAATEADLAALHVDGYVGSVIDELQRRQALPDTAGTGVTAREALGILAALLRDRQHDNIDPRGAA